MNKNFQKASNGMKKEILQKSYFIEACIVVATLIVGGIMFHVPQFKSPAEVNLEQSVSPEQGIVLPVAWDDMGEQLIQSGVIDRKKFEELYARNGGLSKENENLLAGSGNGKLVITKNNAPVLLNLLWALGLANKNPILENGMMTSQQFGGDASRFASTGGWTLASGKPMDHYSRHAFILLTPEQQALVEKVSKNIYRPCCGNSTYFPDCNHGMAMLGLLELMASQGVHENDMYRAALAVNSYWFPDTYVTIAQYEKSRGIAWNNVDAKEVLGAAFSSAAGSKQILAQVQSVSGGKGPSCGV